MAKQKDRMRKPLRGLVKVAGDLFDASMALDILEKEPDTMLRFNIKVPYSDASQPQSLEWVQKDKIT